MAVSILQGFLSTYCGAACPSRTLGAGVGGHGWGAQGRVPAPGYSALGSQQISLPSPSADSPHQVKRSKTSNHK